jgi:flagellar capping protein FliD
VTEITAQEEKQQAGFKIFHPGIKQEVVLPEKIGEGENAIETKSLIEAIIAKSRAEHRGELSRKIQEYETKLSDYEQLRARLDDLETANMTTAQKAQREAEKLASETKKWQSEAEKYRTALHSERLDNALYKIVGSNSDVFNVEQTMRLFKAECAPEIINDASEIKIVASVDNDKLDLSEAFKKWIAKDQNANLLKNKLLPGGGSSGGQKQAQGKTLSKAQFDQLSTADKFAFVNAGGQITE